LRVSNPSSGSQDERFPWSEWVPAIGGAS
jgi:hypothetical protein